MATTVNIPTGASGYRQSVIQQAQQAQRAVNKMQMSPTLNPKGFVQPLGRITNAASEFQKSMDASAARVFAFGAAVGVINGVSDAFKSLVASAAEVEKSLKDVQVVMEVSNSAIKKFGDGIFDVARNTATNFQLVANSAVELARQGLSAEETLARVNSALILSRLSGLDTVKSTEALTAAINSFNKEGITHEQIVNRMANVDASFAVSSADLAEAISRAGAVAQSSGVSFNELASIVTAVQQRTARGGSVIGNGFKSIFTRIKRSGVREALEEIGVATKNNDGSFRSSIDILKDYANVYKTLTDAQKAYTSEQIAGVFQIQNLQALIQDLNSGYSVYNKALSVANNTTDQAIRRNEQLNTTLSAAFSQTSTSAKELAASIGEIALSGNFKEILSFLNSLAKTLNDLISEDQGSTVAKNFVRGLGNFLTGPGLVVLGAAFIKVFALVGKFAKEALSDILGLNKEAKRQQGLQAAIGQALSSNAGLYQQILSASGNSAKQQQILLNLIKQETAERVKQEALIKRMAGSRLLAGVGASEAGFVPVGGKASKARGRKALGLASGFLPAMSKEASDINRGVGGARRGDRPVPMKINTAAGKSQSVVVNTGEFIVKDFAGSGGDAIFNREMIKKFGLPKGAKKINASSGFVPNFAKKKSLVQSRAKEQLDFTKLVTMIVPSATTGIKSGLARGPDGKTQFKINFSARGPNTKAGKRSIDVTSRNIAKQAISRGAIEAAAKLSEGKFKAGNIPRVTNTEAGTTKGRIQEKAIASVLNARVFKSDTATFDFLNPDPTKGNLFDWNTPFGDAKPNTGVRSRNSIAAKIVRFFTPKGNIPLDKQVLEDVKEGVRGNKISKKLQGAITGGVDSITISRGRGRPSNFGASIMSAKPYNPPVTGLASGFIPNFARRMHDGFGMQMGGSGVRSKKFKDSGSYLEYKGNELEYIQSMRKGDANLLFDRFVRQKGSVYSGGIKQNRSFKQGSKTNFEDLIYAFPQLQYRLKKGFSTTGRFVGANGESFRFQSLKDLKDKINKGYRREEFRSYLGGSGVVGMGKMDIQDLTTSRVKGSGDDIYKNYTRGLVPNFAAGVDTAFGFFSTQKINRLKDGDFSKTKEGEKIYLNQFSKEDQALIRGFQAPNSKANIAIAQAARKQAKNEMPTIDASRQATMLVATENFRRKVDTTYKKGDTNFRLKYRAEGLKPSRLKGTETKLRSTMEDLMILESTKLAGRLSGSGKFGANNKPIKALTNAGSPASAAGTVFETAMRSISSNKLFTANNAGFDIAGFPDKGLQNLFGYYTPFADAKIGLTSDTKRDFNSKVINLPTSSKGMSAKDRTAQGRMAIATRQKYGAPIPLSSGFLPQIERAFSLEKTLGGKPVLDFEPGIGPYVRDEKTQKNFTDVKRDHPEGMKKAIKNSKKMQGLSDGFLPNFVKLPNPMDLSVITALQPENLKKLGDIGLKGLKKYGGTDLGTLGSKLISKPMGLVPGFRQGDVLGQDLDLSGLQGKIDEAAATMADFESQLSDSEKKVEQHRETISRETESISKSETRRDDVLKPARQRALDRKNAYKASIEAKIADPNQPKFVKGNAAHQAMEKKLKELTKEYDETVKQVKAENQRITRSRAKINEARGQISGVSGSDEANRKYLKGQVTQSRNKLAEEQGRMRLGEQRAQKQQAAKARFGQYSMAGAFALPMAASFVQGDRTTEQMSSARKTTVDAMNFAGMGAMFGPKGMLIGAGIGVGINALDKYAMGDSHGKLVKITEEFAEAQKILQDSMQETQGINNYRSAISELNVAIESGNIEKIEKLRDVLTNLGKDVPKGVRDKVNKALADGDFKGAQEIVNNAAKEAQRKVKKNEAAAKSLEKFKNFQENKDSMSAKFGRGVDVAASNAAANIIRIGKAMGAFDNLSVENIEAARREQNRKALDPFQGDKRAAQAMADDIVGGLAENVQFSKEQIIAEQMATGGVFGTTPEELERLFKGRDGESIRALFEKDRRFKNLPEDEVPYRMKEGLSVKDFTQIGGLQALIEKIRAEKSSEAMDKIMRALDATGSFKGPQKNYFMPLQTLKNQEFMQLAGRGKTQEDGSYSYTYKGTNLQDLFGLDKQSFDVLSKLQGRSEIFLDALAARLNKLQKDMSGEAKTADAVNKGIKDELKRQVNIEAEAELNLRAVQKASELASRSVEKFKKSVEIASTELNDFSNFLQQGNQFLTGGGRISEDENLRRNTEIQKRTLMANTNLSLRGQLMDILGSNIKISDAYNADEATRLAIMGPGANRKQTSGDLVPRLNENMERQDRPLIAEISKRFSQFALQNLDGNYTLDEISGFLSSIKTLGDKGNSLYQQGILATKTEGQKTRLGLIKIQRDAMLQSAAISRNRLQSAGSRSLKGPELAQAMDLAPGVLEMFSGRNKRSVSNFKFGGPEEFSRRLLGGTNSLAAGISDSRAFASLLGINPNDFLRQNFGITGDDANFLVGTNNINRVLQGLQQLGPGFNPVIKILEQFKKTLADDLINVNKASDFIQKGVEGFDTSALDPESRKVTNVILAGGFKGVASRIAESNDFLKSILEKISEPDQGLTPDEQNRLGRLNETPAQKKERELNESQAKIFAETAARKKREELELKELGKRQGGYSGIGIEEAYDLLQEAGLSPGQINKLSADALIEGAEHYKKQGTLQDLLLQKFDLEFDDFQGPHQKIPARRKFHQVMSLDDAIGQFERPKSSLANVSPLFRSDYEAPKGEERRPFVSSLLREKRPFVSSLLNPNYKPPAGDEITARYLSNKHDAFSVEESRGPMKIKPIVSPADSGAFKLDTTTPLTPSDSAGFKLDTTTPFTAADSKGFKLDTKGKFYTNDQKFGEITARYLSNDPNAFSVEESRGPMKISTPAVVNGSLLDPRGRMIHDVNQRHGGLPFMPPPGRIGVASPGPVFTDPRGNVIYDPSQRHGGLPSMPPPGRIRIAGDGSLTEPAHMGSNKIHDTSEEFLQTIKEASQVLKDFKGVVEDVNQTAESAGAQGAEGPTGTLGPAGAPGAEVGNIGENLTNSLSSALESAVFTHVIKGDINFTFNSEIIEGALGPVMMQKLKELLQDDLILTTLARGLKGYIDPTGLLNNQE